MDLKFIAAVKMRPALMEKLLEAGKEEGIHANWT